MGGAWPHPTFVDFALGRSTMEGHGNTAPVSKPKDEKLLAEMKEFNKECRSELVR